MLTSSTQLQNRSFHVIERTRTSSKCQKMKNARAKRAKILFFIVKHTNLKGSCCLRRRGCLSSLVSSGVHGKSFHCVSEFKKKLTGTVCAMLKNSELFSGSHNVLISKTENCPCFQGKLS